MKFRFLFAAFAVSVPFAAHANLVFNGDFELGNTGFTSDYTLVDPNGASPFPTPPGTPAGGNGTPKNMYDEGTYTVTNVQPSAWHVSWRNDIDLTNHNWYMLFNGSTTAGLTAWTQTISPPLVSGQAYRLSFDVVSVYAEDTAPAELKLSIGGSELISVTAPTGTEGWKNVYADFVFTGVNSTANILNVETTASGNDFGIDNITLTPVPEPTTVAGIGLGVLALLRRRKKK